MNTWHRLTGCRIHWAQTILRVATRAGAVADMASTLKPVLDRPCLRLKPLRPCCRKNINGRSTIGGTFTLAAEHSKIFTYSPRRWMHGMENLLALKTTR